jgi:peptidoglycan-associated lipoprotein
MGKGLTPGGQAQAGRPPCPACPEASGGATAPVAAREALRPIYFCYNEPYIPPYSEDQLEILARYLKENPAARIRVAGHADQRGTEEYNLALGEKRATMARQYLEGRGVAVDRMEIISYGKSRPVNPNCDNEPCYQKNRRVEFEILTQ